MSPKHTDGKNSPRKPPSRGAKAGTGKPAAKAASKAASPKPAAKAALKAAAKPSPKAASKAASPKPTSKKAATKTAPSTAGAKTVSSRGPRRKSAGLLEGTELALAIAREALDKKALNVEIIDVRGKVDYADFVVVMSGRSDRHVVGLAGYVEQALHEKHRTRCSSIEGLPQSAWVLMDYGDVVVHIFHEDTRGYYDVEALWMDAARLKWEEGGR